MKGKINGRKNEVARIVTDRIAVILSNGGFTFTTDFLFSIHRFIFSGVFDFAGQLRKTEAKQKEWVLGGGYSTYGIVTEISNTLEQQFRAEREFSYSGMTRTEIVIHFSDFVSGIWQTHPFEAGNTGTISVFVILYLRSLGFDVNLAQYEKYSWYMRNAMVRSRYNNLKKGITADSSFLYAFFENIMYDAGNVLNSRNVLVRRDRSMLVPERKRDNVRAIEFYIKNAPGSSAVSISRELGIPLRTVQRCIKELSESVEHRGSKKTGGYYPAG